MATPNHKPVSKPLTVFSPKFKKKLNLSETDIELYEKEIFEQAIKRRFVMSKSDKKKALLIQAAQTEYTINPIAEYENQTIDGNKYQAVVEAVGISKFTKRKLSTNIRTMPSHPKLKQRKYLAIYALRKGESTFYAMSKDDRPNNFRTKICESCKNARRWTQHARYRTTKVTRNGIEGVVVTRVK